MTTEYIIEGFRIVSLETFFDEITRVVVPGSSWGHNLDAIDDILRGGFGTPDEGIILKWSHSRFSKEKLGYAETVRQLEIRLKQCHPANRDSLRQELSQARAGVGPTVFDWLIEIIAHHGQGGEQASDNVKLLLG